MIEFKIQSLPTFVVLCLEAELEIGQLSNVDNHLFGDKRVSNELIFVL